jgi:ABC-type Fe3+-siderophore transport system permease subunit
MNTAVNPAENNKEIGRRRFAFVLLLAFGPIVILLIMAFSISMGTAKIPLKTVFEAVFCFNPEDTRHLIWFVNSFLDNFLSNRSIRNRSKSSQGIDAIARRVSRY